MAFYHAAEALLAKAPPDVQSAVMPVIEYLAVTFGDEVQAEGVERIKEWAEKLRVAATLQRRRARCVEAVHRWGGKVRSDPERRLAHAEALVDALKAIGAEPDELRVNPDDPEDEGVIERMRKACPWAEAWRGELDDVAAKLDAYDAASRGKDGAKGASRILAEMIFDGGPFLGLAAKAGDDEEDAIEDMRKALDKAVRARPARRSNTGENGRKRP
jgi:hypothetical protein